MAHSLAELDVPLDADHARDREKGGLRRCRGRPRLTDSDRAQRRLESRKKYDVRRVYLGESHKLWSELRRRTSLSDAGLAEYLVLLNTTYGDKYQQKYCGKKAAPEEETIGRKERVSSLQGLMSWYQEHSRSCPHEPQLGALQPRADASTAAVWRCDSDHSFVQYLFSPAREASDSEHEEGVDREGDYDESAEKTDVPVAKDVGEHADVSGVQCATVSPVEQAAALDLHAGMEASSLHHPLAGPPAWEMEMVIERQQGSPAEAFHSISSEEEEPEEEEEEGEEDLKEPEDLRQGRGGEGEVGAAVPGYECVTAAASLADGLGKADEDSPLSHSAGLGVQPAPPVTPPMQVEEQSELFDPHTLQTVVTSCEIPDQRTTLEGSQLIIITGPSYEALASEGIQLNMGGTSVEEVTCTVIGGVTYSQVSESKLSAAEDEDSMTGLSDKQLLQPIDDALEMSSDRELQRSLSGSVASYFTTGNPRDNQGTIGLLLVDVRDRNGLNTRITLP
ncbi:Zinc finger protein 653 [Liparis tanakae]|uniref:Zinc finger protein 653 n=1 Tax=Liparis tanakae TaxID=230148 RepID=A0A4Z2FIE7_9TELE|nr:Zinc finger protein 653 [Liparis tanakae]